MTLYGSSIEELEAFRELRKENCALCGGSSSRYDEVPLENFVWYAITKALEMERSKNEELKKGI